MGRAAVLVGVLALAGALVAAGLGLASHHFADVKTWFAIAAGAAVLGVVLLLVGRRAVRRAG